MVGRRNTLVLTFSLLLGLSLLAGPAHAVGTKVPVWAPKFMDGAAAVTPTQAVTDARNFDVLAAVKGTYSGQVPAMMQANPSLKTLVYMNAVFAQSGECPSNAGADADCRARGKYPDSLYLKNGTGTQAQYVTSKQHSNWLMNPTRQEWIDDRVKACADFRVESGMEGCMIDLLGTAAVNPGFTVCAGTTTPCAAVDPRDGKPFTAEEWLTATKNVAAKVRTIDPDGAGPATPPAYVYGNGLGNGQKYFGAENTARIVDSVDGAWAENFLRSGARTTPLSTWPSEANWKLDVNMVANVSKPKAQGGKGKPILTTTKLWINTSTEAVKHQWHRFALGSFMLGKSGPGYFSIGYNDGQAARPFYTSPTAYWNKSLGAPSGNYARASNGAYQRTFANGKVVVNPTTGAKSISVGSVALCNFGGTRLAPGKSFSLPAHDAQLLTKC